MKDSELIDLFKADANKGFHLLFKQFYVPLCVYAMRFTRDKAMSEEIVQDTFFKLWERKDNLCEIESFSAYLYQIVRNNCLNHLKHIQVVNKFNEYYNQLLADASEYLTVTRENGQSILIAKEVENHVFSAIDKLPEQCREIFKLSRFEGLKHHEIAEKKGVTVNTVQKQISIALEKLRVALKPFLSFFILLFQ
jgi:RNA polymerase sigma-70 factor (ECF subfamily)